LEIQIKSQEFSGQTQVVMVVCVIFYRYIVPNGTKINHTIIKQPHKIKVLLEHRILQVTIFLSQTKNKRAKGKYVVVQRISPWLFAFSMFATSIIAYFTLSTIALNASG
jgi:hypothetical protein